MNRFILYLFGFFLLAQANALACNFKIANFGSPKENIKLDNNLPEPLLTNSMSKEGKNKIMDVDSCYCDDRPGQSEEQGPASCGCSGSRASFIMKMA